MSDTAWVEFGIGVAGFLITAIAAMIGNYFLMRNSIGDLKTEVRALSTELAGFREWLEKVADGDTASVAEIRTNLAVHEKRLDSHDERIGGLERFAATLSGAHHRQHGEELRT
jgi:hypothetical protein